MKLLAFGDVHGDISLVEKLAKKAEQEHVDLVIMCGDMTHFDSSVENLIGPFKKKNLKILLIPGNHESVATADFLADFYDVKNIHGYSVRYADVGIFGCGGANVGPNRISDSEVKSLLKKSFDKIKYLPKTIMVTHAHPTGTKMEQFTRFFPGSRGVREAVEELKPNILLCSHVHEAEGIEEMIGNTLVVNVGRKGKIFEF
ncbi:MAG: metallophosphoesterase [Nanoarchaeota archaeon]|nr:metallophosphoesterase [Nanoarchaeota archaeon]MBU1029664.1 metallophosphoesterase [Nanoarchaeota archaeon]MBU1849874.1 metallophosphoesterase [Nanoarchaeota archaeon]